ISLKPSARSSSSAASASATEQMRPLAIRMAVVSRVSSAANAGGACMTLATLAIAAVARNRRRLCLVSIEVSLSWSPLQLAFQLVQQAPIGTLGDDRVRVGLDHAGFVQSQRMKPHGVFGIVFAPLVVGNCPQCLQCEVVIVGEAAIDNPAGD